MFMGVMTGVMYCGNVNIPNKVSKDEYFLGDTGAQMHAVGEKFGITNPEKGKIDDITMGDASHCKVITKGDLPIETSHGVKFKLRGVFVCPKLRKSVLSITQLIKEGWRIGNDRKAITLMKGSDKLEFLQMEKNLYYLKARRIVGKTEALNAHLIPEEESDDDSMPGLVERRKETVRWDDEDNYPDDLPPLVSRHNDSSDDEDSDEEGGAWTSVRSHTTQKKRKEERKAATIKKGKLMKQSINEAHNQWGHHGVKHLKVIAEMLNIELVGQLKSCDGCGIAKAKRKSIPKTTAVKATRPGEHLFVDTAGPFSETLARNKYWQGAVDDFSGKLFSCFATTKKNIDVFIRGLLEGFKGRATPVKYLRCDNAGENIALNALCREFGVTTEFTVPNTPQYNGRIERRFAVVLQMALAMLYAAGIKPEWQAKLWAEAVVTAAFLGDLGPTQRSKIPAQELFDGKPSKWYGWLKEFGRVGHVTIKSKIKGKQSERATSMIMVGYALDHPVGSYRFFNPETERVIISDSVKWGEFKPWNAHDKMELFEEIRANSVAGVEDDDEDELGNDDRVTKNDKVIKDRASDDEVTEDGIEINQKAASQTPASAPKSPEGATTRSRSLKSAMRSGDQYKVTGDTVAKPIVIEDFADNEEDGGEEDPEKVLNHFLFNTAINSDPGTPKIREALNGPQ